MIRPVRVIVGPVLVALAIVAVVDYGMFRSRDRRARGVVAELGGRGGSIGGWPIGKEYVIAFTRPLDDDELRRLAALNELAGKRFYFGIHFRNSSISDERLAEFREMLSGCHVSCHDVKQ